MIANDIKKYDLDEMKIDINHKMATNVNNLKKNHRGVIADEQKNKRQLEKID